LSDILETPAAEPAAPSSSGGAPNQDGNTLAEHGTPQVAEAPSERAGPGWKQGLNEAINEAQHRIDSLSRDDEQPIDLDAPREWQGPEVRKEVEALLKEQREQQQEPPAPAQRPSDYPRSWANDADAFGVWNQLQPQVREQIRTREDQRDGEVTRRQSEFAERARQADAAVAQAEQFNLASLEALLPELQPYAHLTQQQLDELGRTNPQEAARVRDLYGRAETLSKRVEAFAQQRAERQRQQAEQQQVAAQQAQEQFFERCRQSWQQEKQAADEATVKMIPELSDPVKREEITKTVYAYTEKLGISREQLHHWYETEPLLRGAVGQRVLHDAAQWHRAQQRAYEAVPKQQPKPLLPGTNNGPSRISGDAALAAAASNGDMDTYFRLRGNSGARR
jgi:cytochrome c2